MSSQQTTETAARPTHALTSMPDRFYCTCGYGYDGPKRTARGLRTHIKRANSTEAGQRARTAHPSTSTGQRVSS